MRKNTKKGFTLTELIIVIVIIGILAAVLIPTLSGNIKKAKKSAAEQDALSIYAEFTAAIDDNNQYLEATEKNYYVQSGDYYVFISKGTLVGSVYEDDVVFGTATPDTNPATKETCTVVITDNNVKANGTVLGKVKAAGVVYSQLVKVDGVYQVETEAGVTTERVYKFN